MLAMPLYLYASTSRYSEAIKYCLCLTGPCTEHGVKYTVYLISVSKQYYGSQDVEKWDVCRRYSDFHDFHMLLQEKVIAFDTLLCLSQHSVDGRVFSGCLYIHPFIPNVVNTIS